jgi:hypothetical protein
MNSSTLKKYIWISLLLSLAISLTIHFSIIVETLFDDGMGRHGQKISLEHASFDFFSTVIMAFLLFLLNYRFFKPFDAHYSLKFRNIAISTALTFLVAFIFAQLFILVKHTFETQSFEHRHNEDIFFRNFFCAAIVMICISIMRLIFQKQTIKLENEKLRSESLQSQFESLKNQVSPHFLFNSLTALKVLVEDSPSLAKQYISHLSQVLRYTLQSNQKQLVTLGEELEFTESYFFLLKMRYDSNLTIKTEIDEHLKDYLLPPLTIQTLVENAVKHNEISKEFPLTISILSTTDKYIVVANKIQEKLTQEDGTGIGLTNLSKLFLLLGENDIQIYRRNNEFKVEVPLIKPYCNEGAHN